MSEPLHPIRSLISEDLINFEKLFNDAIQSRNKLMNLVMNYIIKRKGKQMRPLFVYLSAAVFGKINPSTHRGAVLIELLHNATLIHDDVVDEANYRRGFLTLNSIWQNKVSVLVGDYLLAKGLLLSIDNNDFALLKIVSQAVQEMSEGELLQLEKSKKLNITENIYFQIIRQKTAILIASCCAIGAHTAGSSEEHVRKAKLFGEKIGIAFQLKDDLLDFSRSHTGKPTGIDLQSKNLSLPLIHSLDKADAFTRLRMYNLIRKKNKTHRQITQLIEFSERMGGIQYTEKKMKEFLNEAKEILNSFRPSLYRDALDKLIANVTTRTY
ncbi:octaprenyl-diphosphate synthase [Hydrobacter penzbergensis]|uniref:Octaprenyl-diphosphate synthase n=1 Tax=Hydrobacter penzbergensis TaxID=1235997 RepID=A0A8X8IF71_9BACT|nr:polyprenyl synthetase family protein [Hydrobacter penzbergensis]SDX00475.1 octaprenyl-diphosphate synthase [Hydrobacter penzbergensis]